MARKMQKLKTLEEFILLDGFRKYCLAPEEIDTAYWTAYLRTFPEQQPLFEEARRQIIDLYTVLDSIRRKELLDRIKYEIEHIGELAPYGDMTRVHGIRKRFSSSLLWWSAAVVALFLVCGTLWWQLMDLPKGAAEVSFSANYTTGTSERKEFHLPDGSKVVLNAESSLSLDEGFNSRNRRMKLQGEAFFEVAKDKGKPFIISTRSMDIRVLGTVFNVKAYENEAFTTTSLISGVVEVELKYGDKKKIKLRPSEKVTVANLYTEGSEQPQIPQKKVDEYKIGQLQYDKESSTMAETSWTKDKFMFKGDSFLSIAATLERWYDVKFVFEDEASKNRSYNASFNNDESLESILSTLQAAAPFNYKQKQDTIYINTKPN